MNILSLIESATGNTYKKKASTRGGEYSGPCFNCGGEDRFSIHPEQDHFVCRGCKSAGDSISFVMKFYSMKYKKACEYLNITPKFNDNILDTATEKPGQNEITWKPREIILPSITWQDKAAAFLFEAYKYLLSPSGKIHRDWLNARGISNSTIKQARMGWCERSVSFSRESWGLAPEKNQTGQNKQIWIPAGLIIPYFRDDKPIRLRIRQVDPVASDRFIMVAGSSMGYLDCSLHQGQDPEPDKPVLITESEIDSWLLYQALGDLVQVYAVGNSSARPDTQTHKQLQHRPILLNLDNDDAGHNEQSWWKTQYPSCLTWYSEFGKDPGESFEAGVDIRAWGEEGLKQLNKIKQGLPVKKLISTNQENFKNKVVAEYQEKKPTASLPQTISQKIKSKPKETSIKIQACVHNQYCSSLKENICSFNNQNPFEILKCPKDQWYPHTTGVVTEIILGPGVKKI